jgi:hypothetical protein
VSVFAGGGLTAVWTGGRVDDGVAGSVRGEDARWLEDGFPVDFAGWTARARGRRTSRALKPVRTVKANRVNMILSRLLRGEAQFTPSRILPWCEDS